MKLRKAQPPDARALAAFAEATFRATFASQNSADDMATHCSSTYGEELQRGEIENPAFLTLLAEDGGEIAGYGQLRWGKAPACVKGLRPAEILRLYVGHEWHGRGVAQELMRRLISAAEKGGADPVWLGVWEHNPRAIAFYEKIGFRAVGEHEFRLGSDVQRDLVMVLQVVRKSVA